MSDSGSQPPSGQDASSALEVTGSAAPTVGATAAKIEKPASERVIINAPMSFAGAAQRSMRIRGRTTGLVRIGLTVVALFLMFFWWILVASWYTLFGLLLVPYRVLRRGARKRKAEALRHREMLNALDKH